MDDRQNNRGQRRSIGGGNGSNNRTNNGSNNRPNNTYSKYGNMSNSNSNYNKSGNNSRPINGGVRYTNNGNTEYNSNNMSVGYGKNNPGYGNTGYGNQGYNNTGYNNGYNQNTGYSQNNGYSQSRNNIGNEKYDDIKGLSEGYEDYNMEGDNMEDDIMDNPIDKKQLVKKRVILGVKIFCIVMLAAIIVGGTVFYLKYGKEIMQMRKDAKELVANSTRETFAKSSQHKYYAFKTGSNGSKELVELDMGLGSGKYLKVSDGGENMALARDLMVYSEDRKFYSHHGVDFWANVKAVILMILNGGKADRGGSTITQQLARNVLLEDFDKNWRRKVKEIFVSWEMENKYTKEDIIEFYLNNINFSNGYMGIENAAYGYFGKSVKELKKGEVAYLCAIPNNPSLYNPYDLTSVAKTVKGEDPEVEYTTNKYTCIRATRLLGQLKKYGKDKIDDADYTAAIKLSIKLPEKSSDSKSGDKYTVDRMLRTFILKCAVEKIMTDDSSIKFTFMYPDQLKSVSAKSTYDELYEQAYTAAENKLNQSSRYIYTSLDIDMIEKLQESIDNGIKNGGKNDAKKKVKKSDENTYEVQGAGVTMNKNGYVVAMVNGRTGLNNADNWMGRAFGANSSGNPYKNLARQPGSSIKPLVVYAPVFELEYQKYIENLKAGKNENTFGFLDQPVEDQTIYKFSEDEDVKNSNSNHIASNMRQAIQQSSNVVAYKYIENKDNFLGIDNWGVGRSINFLKMLNFNFTTENDKKNRRISLGGFDYGTTPLEMCAAYTYLLTSTTNEYIRPTCIMKIANSDDDMSNGVLSKMKVSTTRKSIFSKDTLARMREGLMEVFESGGTAAASKPDGAKKGLWQVAGKTGTTDNNVDGWFCGATPTYATDIWV